MRNTDHTSSQDETKEKAEEKEKEKKEKEVKPHTLKSNNPHLTGGEQQLYGESNRVQARGNAERGLLERTETSWCHRTMNCNTHTILEDMQVRQRKRGKVATNEFCYSVRLQLGVLIPVILPTRAREFGRKLGGIKRCHTPV